MITICNTNYLSSPEARQFLKMAHRNWQLYRFRIPFVKHQDKCYWKLSDLEDIKEKLDIKKYLGEAHMVLELDTYWRKFKKIANEINVPRVKHPFHSRMLYRVSDIAAFRRALYAKSKN